MKPVIFTAIISAFCIAALHIYTTVNRDNGYMCSHSWAFFGEEDFYVDQPYKTANSPPRHFKIDEDVSGTLTDLRIRHVPGDENLASTVLISNQSEEPYLANLLMKLIHGNLEYQMDKVMLSSDFSIIDTPNEPIRLIIEANSEQYLTFIFDYKIFNPKLDKQSLQQVLLTNTEESIPTILIHKELTRFKRTINCIFGIGLPYHK